MVSLAECAKLPQPVKTDMSEAIEDPSRRLHSELSSYRRQSAARFPELSAAYDALVEHLTALDTGEIGPKIGEKMPSFMLPDETDQLVSSACLLAAGPVVISFNRGHWCPYCRIALRALAGRFARIRDFGASVVAIMPDTAQFTADYKRDNDLPFPILSDIDLGYSLSVGLVLWVGAEIEKLYRDAGIALDIYHGNKQYFLPIAATFIVDQHGIVRARQVNLEFRERMEPETIVSVLTDLRAP
jgi:peroxiredoxin